MHKQQKQNKQQQEEEKCKIIYKYKYLIDGGGKPCTLRVLLSCCYQTLETCSHFVLTICQTVHIIELAL
jgi:hypothetical protein